MQADRGCRAGDPAAAVRLSQQLLALGADVTLRSRWTNMNALHYAAYFDVPDLVRVLLKGARPRGEGRVPAGRGGTKAREEGWKPKVGAQGVGGGEETWREEGGRPRDGAQLRPGWEGRGDQDRSIWDCVGVSQGQCDYSFKGDVWD